MGDGRQPSQPSELVYTPAPSWVPVLTAAGFAGVLVGLFAGFPYAVAGAVVLLAALRAWIRDARYEITRLPREQHLTSAVLPAVPLRRREP